MNCFEIDLRTDLNPTAAAGGQWSYVGYNAASSSGPFAPDSGTTGPLINFVDTSPPDNWGFKVGLSATVEGYYQFRYETQNAQEPSCTDEAFVIVEVLPKNCGGTTGTVLTCEEDNVATSVVDLSNGTNFNCDMSESTVTVSVISSPTGAGTVLVGGTDFNPSNNTVGNHVIQFVADPVSGAFTSAVDECDECNETSLLTIENRGFSNWVTYLIEANPSNGYSFTGDEGIISSNYTNAPFTTNGSWYYYGDNPSTSTGPTIDITGLTLNPGDTIGFGINTLLDFIDTTPGTYYLQYCIYEGEPCESCELVEVLVEPSCEFPCDGERQTDEYLTDSYNNSTRPWLDSPDFTLTKVIIEGVTYNYSNDGDLGSDVICNGVLYRTGLVDELTSVSITDGYDDILTFECSATQVCGTFPDGGGGDFTKCTQYINVSYPTCYEWEVWYYASDGFILNRFGNLVGSEYSIDGGSTWFTSSGSYPRAFTDLSGPTNYNVDSEDLCP